MNGSHGPSVRWLHISDMHIRDPRGPGKQGDQVDVLKAFLKFCRDDMRNRHHFLPDFVFITGDLAFTGTAGDYTGTSGPSVQQFLNDLIAAIPSIDKSRIFVVSGNHDVDRKAIGGDQAARDLAIADRSNKADNDDEFATLCGEVVDRLFPEPDCTADVLGRDYLLERHRAFAQFCVEYFTADRYPGYASDSTDKRILPVLTYPATLRVNRDGQDYSFGLAGLCSTWASQSHFRKYAKDKDPSKQEDKPGTQFICLRTVRDAITALQDATFRIVLLHHPPQEWLIRPEADRLKHQGSLFGQFDMILTGHAHQAEPIIPPPYQGLLACRSSAGSLFDGFAQYNAFNLVEVWPEAREGRRMVVAWHGTSGTGIWAPDTAIGAGDLWRPFRLAGGPAADAPSGVPLRTAAQPPDLSGYCRRMLERLTITLIADAKRRCAVDRLYVGMEVTWSDRRRPEDEPAEDKAPEGSERKDKRHWLDKDARAEEQARRAAVQRVSLGAALRDQPLSILIAGPGAGKTTSLQWLAFQAARQHGDPRSGELPPDLQWLRGLTPILVSARDLIAERHREIRAAEDRPAPPTAESLFDFLRTEAAAGRFDPQGEACIRDALERRTGLLLIDGLDEVAPTARAWIIALAAEFPGNRVVFSARPGGYAPEEHDSRTRAVRLVPFDRPRMAAYLDLWFAFRREWKDNALSANEIARRRQEILRAIDRSDAIRALAETPLLLATMAIVQEVDVHLPENRAELYQRCTLLLLGYWTERLKLEPGVPPDEETLGLISTLGGWDFPKRRQIFEIVAYRLFTERTELNPPVERDELIALLRAAIEHVVRAEGGTPHNAGAQADALLRLAAHRSGLLVEHTPNRFTFLHATFQEYLTARYFCGAAPPEGNAEWSGSLVEHCPEPYWREVIRLTVAELTRDPSDTCTRRLNELMSCIATRIEQGEPESDAWLDLAETAVGCLEDLVDRGFPGADSMANCIAAVASHRAGFCSEWASPPRVLRLALRLTPCVVRRGMLDGTSISELATACFGSLRSYETDLGDVWGAIRALSDVQDPRLKRNLAWLLEPIALMGTRNGKFAACALLELCGARTVRNLAYRLTADLLYGIQNQECGIPVAQEAVKDWRLVLAECEFEPRLFVVCAMVADALVVWPAERYSRAAVRAFASESSREAGVRVLRALLADPATRPAALEALRAGLDERDSDIAGTSARLLAEAAELPAPEGARAAVRAFYLSSSREAGVRVLRALLADPATRPAALEALRAGLDDSRSGIAVTSASLLAEAAELPAPERARAAVRAFASESSREAGVRVLRALLADPATRPAALEALRAGLDDSRSGIAVTSARLLAEAAELPAPERARAAVRAFASESSREAGVRVLRALLADPATRPAALEALRAGLDERDSGIAGTSARLLAEAAELPAPERARAAVRAFAWESSREAGVRVLRALLADPATRPAALEALRAGLDDSRSGIAVTSASLLAEAAELPAPERARAAVRAFYLSSSREAGVRVLRALLADPATRPAALEALRAGLDERDSDIAGTSASLLAEAAELPAPERARAAVRAFASESSREAGVRVLRALLADPATRPAALEALRAGLDERDSGIAVTSARLLAEAAELPAPERARAAVRAFASESSREAGVRVLRALLADPATRPAALEALRAGLDERDSDIAGTSARLLAEAAELPAPERARAAVRAFASESSREAGVRVLRALLADPATRPAALEALRAGLDERDSDIAGTSARLLAEAAELPAPERARAAVRAFASESSREAGVRVLRALLADPATRPAALEALRAGLDERDSDIAGTSASLLAEAAELPAPEGARAAVRAFYLSSSREAGVRVLRALLADPATRPAALEALRAGLDERDSDIAGTSASLLAEAAELPAPEGARAAVRAFASESSREAGVRVLRALLADPATRPAALEALRAGLDERDSDIAGTSARLLAEAAELPAPERARAAVRAFASESSREAGVRVLRALLADPATRPAALEALRAGLDDSRSGIAGTSARLLAEAAELPAPERARAAVRAFASESSREAGVRVLRALLADPATRPAGLAALRQGVKNSDPLISERCTQLLDKISRSEL